jgi:hypothetical protein
MWLEKGASTEKVNQCQSWQERKKDLLCHLNVFKLPNETWNKKTDWNNPACMHKQSCMHAQTRAHIHTHTYHLIWRMKSKSKIYQYLHKSQEPCPTPSVVNPSWHFWQLASFPTTLLLKPSLHLSQLSLPSTILYSLPMLQRSESKMLAVQATCLQMSQNISIKSILRKCTDLRKSKNFKFQVICDKWLVFQYFIYISTVFLMQ